MPLYVVLMSVLGGARHWLGPAVGATIITALALRVHRRPAGRARAARCVALVLILVILLLPEGVVPGGAGALAALAAARPAEVAAVVERPRPAPAVPAAPLACEDVWRASAASRRCAA